MDSLSTKDRARYCYLRGMNAYRLGTPFRADARHWLAVARAEEKKHQGSLTTEWKERLDEALRDLNQDVHGSGSDDAVNDDAKSESKPDKGDKTPSKKSDSRNKGED